MLCMVTTANRPPRDSSASHGSRAVASQLWSAQCYFVSVLCMFWSYFSVLQHCHVCGPAVTAIAGGRGAQLTKGPQMSGKCFWIYFTKFPPVITAVLYCRDRPQKILKLTSRKSQNAGGTVCFTVVLLSICWCLSGLGSRWLPISRRPSRRRQSACVYVICNTSTQDCMVCRVSRNMDGEWEDPGTATWSPWLDTHVYSLWLKGRTDDRSAWRADADRRVYRRKAARDFCVDEVWRSSVGMVHPRGGLCKEMYIKSLCIRLFSCCNYTAR